MFEFDPRGSYMMPAHFGMPPIDGVPSLKYRDVTAMTVVYLTDAERLAAHLPAPFEVGAEPLVTVTYAANRQVDFLAGHGYNMIRVTAAAAFNGEKDRFEGQFALVLWENLADPILTGREMAGIPKLFADIPDHEIVDAGWRCSASHFGHRILDMSISGPLPVTTDEIVAFQEAGRGKDNPMGWRYLPRVGDAGAALSEPTIFPYENQIDEAWVGAGSIDWKRLTWEQNPTQFHIVNALAALPVLEYRPALISRGSSNLFVPNRPSRVLR
jgi:hypothetical protein